MRLFNTLQGKKQEFVPLKKGKVGIYFCGMTLQESPHVGHMRAIISADILHRYLLYKGYDVTLLINFTDIYDKVIEKSFEEGIDYREITARYEEEFLEASNWLNILPATVYPRATQHIQEIIELIQRIIEKGYAYEVDGNVYFSVKKFKDYGKLSGKNIDQLRSGARVDIDEKKRDPLDFSLWKKAKKGEPYWLSPWGKGRPGWHIECSSMSMHYLGETFDIHGGGNDLIFPHHENEIAQSESATGKPFAKYWIHNGMLTLRGDKMSKSLKNFVPILDMKGSISPNAIRYYILGTHYRSPLEYNDKIINQAKNGWERIKVFLSSVPDSDNKVLQETRDKFEEYMDDDLNTPKVLGYIFELIKEANKSDSETNKSKIKSNVVFLLEGLGFKIESEKLDYAPFVELLLEVREELRKKGMYEFSDKIREGLEKRGVKIEDTPSGTRWRKV